MRLLTCTGSCKSKDGQVYGAKVLTLYSYFEGGTSSVYFWDIDDGFAGCVLLKKCATQCILICATVLTGL